MAQARFLTARAVTRLVIGRYLQAPPRSFRIDTDPYGKPGLTGSSGAGGLAFNLSHTGGKGMLALACDRRLGIDVQDWRQVRDAAGLVRRCFAESEQAYWFDLEFSRREAELFRLWALKEAFCKAVGRGLALGLNRCVFDCRGTRPRLVSAPEAADGIGQWHFAELALPTGTSGAIACDRGISKLRRFMFEHPARF